MFMPSLNFLGKIAPLAASEYAESPAHAKRLSALHTLQSILEALAAKLLHAALFVVMPLQSTSEPVAPRHLQQMIGLMRRAEQLENTQPDAAAELRWLASTYCHE